MTKITNPKLRRYLDHMRNKLGLTSIQVEDAAERGTKRGAKRFLNTDGAADRRYARRAKKNQ